MKRHKNLLFALPFLIIGQLTFAAVNKKAEESKLLEELTGQKAATTPVAKAAAPANLALSKRHLDAGIIAFKNKNYILALKHYNTVIVKYPTSPEVKTAFLAKARLYHEMGLTEQSSLNLRKANEIITVNK